MSGFYQRTSRPLLLIQGDGDQVVSPESGKVLAQLTTGTLAVFRGSGHFPNMRDPVTVNLLIKDFVERVAA